MEKDFDAWNIKKKGLHNRADAPFFHEREIWWCSIGINIGSEQDGSDDEYSRPVLVLKGLSKETFFAVPLTTSAKVHFMRPPIGKVEGKDAHALLSQIRIVDSKRLVRKVGYLNKKIFEDIRKTVKGML